MAVTYWPSQDRNQYRPSDAFKGIFNMKPKLITNHEARQAVRARQSFRNKNQTMFARWEQNGRYYVVYSYRLSWPMWLWDDRVQCWFGNRDRFSVTTSKHMSQSHPDYDAEVRMLPRELLLEVLKRED